MRHLPVEPGDLDRPDPRGPRRPRRARAPAATASSRSARSSAARPVKGPADRLMGPLGIEVSCVGVARAYARVLRHARDRRGRRRLAPAVEAAGVHAVVADTMMRSPEIAAASGPPRARGRRLTVRGRDRSQIMPVDGIGEVAAGRRARRRILAAAAAHRARPLVDRRLPRRDAEDRVEGRGPARRRSTPTTSTARRRLVESESVRIVRRRGDLDHQRDAARLRVRERGHRPVERRSGSRRAAAGRPRPVGEAHPRRVPRRAPASTSRSSISDTFGRPWRRGLTDVAIGVSGIAADRRPARDARRARPRSARHRGRGRRRDRGRGRARDGQGVGHPGRDRAGPRPELVPRGLVPRARAPAARGPVPMTSDRVVPAFIEARRSIRAFLTEAGRRARMLDALVEAACIAPAPHHSRPWRFVVVDDRRRRRQALAARHGRRAGAPISRATAWHPTRVDELVDASHAKITGAPALVLGCLTWDGLDRYPDEARQRAEWGMALLSLGAAVENLMLAAADRGLASCWVAAPIFCPEAARDASRAPRRVAARTRSCWSATPTRPTSAAHAPAASPSTTLRTLTRRLSRRERVSGKSRRSTFEVLEGAARAPSSMVVHGFQPRWISARPGRARCARAHPARGGSYRARLLEPGRGGP